MSSRLRYTVRPERYRLVGFERHGPFMERWNTMTRSKIWFKGTFFRLALASSLLALATVTASAWAAPIEAHDLAKKVKSLPPGEWERRTQAIVTKGKPIHDPSSGKVTGSMSVVIPSLAGHPDPSHKSGHKIDYEMTVPPRGGGALPTITIHNLTTGQQSTYTADEEKAMFTIHAGGKTTTVQAHGDGTWVVNGTQYPDVKEAAAAIVTQDHVRGGIAPEGFAAVRELVNSHGSRSSLSTTLNTLLTTIIGSGNTQKCIDSTCVVM